MTDRQISPPTPGPASAAPDAPASSSGRRPASGQAGRTVQYKGGDLEAERGPGLGCFWFQVAILAVLVVLTPITVSLSWPSEVSAVLLFVTIGLLLLTGQTVIFLLRLVAADRRGRRRPVSSATKTVGELEDEGASRATPHAAADAGHPAAADAAPPAAAHTGPESVGDVRQ